MHIAYTQYHRVLCISNFVTLVNVWHHKLVSLKCAHFFFSFFLTIALYLKNLKFDRWWNCMTEKSNVAFQCIWQMSKRTFPILKVVAANIYWPWFYATQNKIVLNRTAWSWNSLDFRFSKFFGRKQINERERRNVKQKTFFIGNMITTKRRLYCCFHLISFHFILFFSVFCSKSSLWKYMLDK